MRIAERRKAFTLRLLVQATAFVCRLKRSTQHFSNRWAHNTFNEEPLFGLSSIRPKQDCVSYIRLKPSTREVQAVLWDTNTRGEEPLTEPQQGGLFIYDWSPDGKSILASAENPRTGRTEVWQIPTDKVSTGRQTWKLVAARPSFDLFQAQYLPNGRWIAFEGIQDSARGQSAATFLVAASGGEWTQLTDGRSWDDKPHWSPDGRLIYFLSGRRGFYNVFYVPVDTEHGKTAGPPSQVTDFRDASLVVGRTIPSVEIGLSRHKLFVTTSQSTGGIWVLDPANH